MKTQQGNILRKIRKEHNLTQNELCERLGISRTHYSKIENGILAPTQSYLLRLLAFYNITIEEFMKRVEMMDFSNLDADKILKLCFPTEESLKYAAMSHLSHVLDTATPQYINCKNEISSEFIQYIQKISHRLEIDYIDRENRSFKELIKSRDILNSDIEADTFIIRDIILKNYDEEIIISIEKFIEFQEDVNAFAMLYLERFLNKIKGE